MSVYNNKPPAFFEIVIHDPERLPGLTGACAGYEGKEFRNDDLAEHLVEWLPEFAMKFSELEEFNSGTSRRMLRRAAKTVYTTEKVLAKYDLGQTLDEFLKTLPDVDATSLNLSPIEADMLHDTLDNI